MLWPSLYHSHSTNRIAVTLYCSIIELKAFKINRFLCVLGFFKKKNFISTVEYFIFPLQIFSLFFFEFLYKYCVGLCFILYFTLRPIYGFSARSSALFTISAVNHNLTWPNHTFRMRWYSVFIPTVIELRDYRAISCITKFVVY